MRAARAGATVVDLFDRAEVFGRDGYRCYLCRALTDPSVSQFSPTYPTVDHVVPLSKGGSHTLGNVRTACLGCNSRKQDRLVVIAS
ncbi:HNH endonuclease [Streptomyces sp. NPDC054956]